MWTRTDALYPARSATDESALAALLERPGVRRALAALARDGEEARIVGGAVRDALMGRAVSDVDIAVTLPPDEVMALARREGWKAIPTGIEHGTVTLIVDDERMEATTLRRDVATDGRRATVAYTRDFAEDALRRDFTMNALSLSGDGRVHDYATGVADARAGLVRFMGDPETRIREDYLRILRFFRFNASHGRGAPDAPGLAACAALKEGMARLSRERLRQETLKLLAAAGAVPAAEAMDRIALWPLVLPGLACDVARLRRLAAAESSCGRPADPILRLAALCAGEGDALQAALALSNAERQRIDAARAAAAALADRGLSDVALRRALFAHGAAAVADGGLLLAGGETWGEADPAELLGRSAALAAALPANPFRSADAAALGVAPGPRMGRVLRVATEAWLEAGLPDGADRHADLLRQAVDACD